MQESLLEVLGEFVTTNIQFRTEIERNFKEISERKLKEISAS